MSEKSLRDEVRRVIENGINEATKYELCGHDLYWQIAAKVISMIAKDQKIDIFDGYERHHGKEE